MTSQAPIYIAGVGSSPSPKSKDGLTTALISAATKALLDAGVSYDDITHAISFASSGNPSTGRRALDALGQTGIPIREETDRATCLNRATNYIKKDGGQSVLVVGVEKDATVSLVLTSEAFFWHHPYLKDTAVVIKDQKAASSSFTDLCKSAYTLRGWSSQSSSSNSTTGLTRADNQDPPSAKDVKHKNDGRQRLGHNPAENTMEISLEDWLAVRSKRKGSGKKKGGEEGLEKAFKRRGGDRAMLEAKL